MNKPIFLFLFSFLFSWQVFSQSNAVSLHFSGGTSGFVFIDKGGVLHDVYNTLIQEQENGLFYNVSLGYAHSFGRFSVGADVSWNRLQETYIHYEDTVYYGSGAQDYVGLTYTADNRYRYLNANAVFGFDIIQHDVFSLRPVLKIGAAHIFSERILSHFDFTAVLDDYSSDQKSDTSDFRPVLINISAGIQGRYMINEKWAIEAELAYTTFLQHWVKLDYPEKSWYRFYAAGGSIGLSYSF